MKAGQITSIVSASADNNISYLDRHSGFQEYSHCICMNKEEAEVAFDIVARDDHERLQMIMKVTGGIPLS